jgi:hypothetical protein
VPRDVGQGLLADPVEGDLDAWRERPGAVHRRETRGDACLGLPAVREDLESLGQRAAFERGGAEVEDGAAGLVEIEAGEV